MKHFHSHPYISVLVEEIISILKIPIALFPELKITPNRIIHEIKVC